MAKPDYAHKMTDAELAKLEQRIAKLYKEAADELTDTVKAYFAGNRSWGVLVLILGFVNR